MGIEIKEGGFGGPRVIELLRIHVTRAGGNGGGSAQSAGCFGADVADVRFWTAWDGDLVLGTAALKHIRLCMGK